MEQHLMYMLPGAQPEEFLFIQNITKDLTEDQKKQFFMYYQSKRKDPQQILIFTILGFVVVAGIQRFILGQIGMGILYFLTAGLCFIGTIIDLVNYKKMTTEYNTQQAMEVVNMIKVMDKQ